MRSKHGYSRQFIELDPAGRVLSTCTPPPLDGFNLVHDFALTSRYYVVFQASIKLESGLCPHLPLLRRLSGMPESMKADFFSFFF